MVAFLCDKYNWTPDEVLDLSLYQISLLSCDRKILEDRAKMLNTKSPARQKKVIDSGLVDVVNVSDILANPDDFIDKKTGKPKIGVIPSR